jgi:polycystin 2
MATLEYQLRNTHFNLTRKTFPTHLQELSGFSVMFFIIFFAFSYLGYLLFGSQIYGYSSVVRSSYTMFRTMLGDFDLGEIEKADRTFGPLYLMSYIFFVFFVLLNVFLAIINDTYGMVKERVLGEKPSFQVGDFFKVGLNNIKGAAGIQVRDTSLLSVQSTNIRI